MLLIRNQLKTNREMIDFTTETQRTRRQKYDPQITQITQISGSNFGGPAGTKGNCCANHVFNSCDISVSSRNLRNL
jgi:hypothetical protein